MIRITTLPLLIFALLCFDFFIAEAQEDWDEIAKRDWEIVNSVEPEMRKLSDNAEARLEIFKEIMPRLQHPGLIETILYSTFTWFDQEDEAERSQAIADWLESMELEPSTPLTRSVIHAYAARFRGRAGQPEAVSQLAEKVGRNSEAGVNQHVLVAEAAANTELWDIALEHANQAIEEADEPYGYEQEGQIEQELPKHLGEAYTWKIAALAGQNNHDEAEQTWQKIQDSIEYSYAGIPTATVLLELGESYIDREMYDTAIEILTPNALFDYNPAYMERLMDVWKQKHGSTEGLDEYLWQARLDNARVAGPVTLYDYQCEPVELSEFRGSVVLLSFWFPNCAPCRRELPALKPGYQQLKDEGFKIVVVDSRRNAKGAQAFIKEHDLPYTFLQNGEGDKEFVADHFRVGVFPTNYLLDREGRVMYQFRGYQPGSEDKILEAVRYILEHQPEE